MKRELGLWKKFKCIMMNVLIRRREYMHRGEKMKFTLPMIGLFLLLAVGMTAAVDVNDFCNVMETGITFSGTAVSMTTMTGNSHVGASILKPVTTTYSADVAGIGTVSSFMRGTSKGATTSYSFSQQTSASGTIMKYFAEYHWSSGGY